MSEINRSLRNGNGVNMQQVVNQEIAAVRNAWRLTPPESDFREPQWLKSAASRAAKAGKLPKRLPGEPVISLLHRAGYDEAIDHMAIVRENGERHVILEPYESACSMDSARRIAAELATRLGCDAWASLRSWHYPGRTIRITLAPLRDKAPEANADARADGTPSQAENATAGQPGAHVASADPDRGNRCPGGAEAAKGGSKGWY